MTWRTYLLIFVFGMLGSAMGAYMKLSSIAPIA